MELHEKVLELKRKKNAIVLVHNYQMGEVQLVADHLGDSLGLARIAMEARKDLIVFCGVRFMAETAKILNPNAKVLIPREDATCPMADMIEPADVKSMREKYPGALVCSYVNTNADVKAERDEAFGPFPWHVCHKVFQFVDARAQFKVVRAFAVQVFALGVEFRAVAGQFLFQLQVFSKIVHAALDDVFLLPFRHFEQSFIDIARGLEIDEQAFQELT